MLERRVLLSPNAIARAAMSLVSDPAQRWMLGQPAAVRRSYVHDVLDRGNTRREQTIWMLRQPDAVRAGYAAAVLAPGDHATRWMLGQPREVRESYISDVITKG
jgi:hypothetical protein